MYYTHYAILPRHMPKMAALAQALNELALDLRHQGILKHEIVGYEITAKFPDWDIAIVYKEAV